MFKIKIWIFSCICKRFFLSHLDCLQMDTIIKTFMVQKVKIKQMKIEVQVDSYCWYVPSVLEWTCHVQRLVINGNVKDKLSFR